MVIVFVFVKIREENWIPTELFLRADKNVTWCWSQSQSAANVQRLEQEKIWRQIKDFFLLNKQLQIWMIGGWMHKVLNEENTSQVPRPTCSWKASESGNLTRKTPNLDEIGSVDRGISILQTSHISNIWNLYQGGKHQIWAKWETSDFANIRGR